VQYALAPEANTPMLSAVRASIYFMGLQWYRQHGFYEKYLRLVDPSVLNVILTATTNEWLPLNVLDAHYRASAQLELTLDEHLELGEWVSSVMYTPTLRTLAQLAGKLGVSPWVGLARTPKLWEKTSRGGGIRVERLGSRSALVVIYKVPYAHLRLYRNISAGLFRGGARVFTPSPQVTVEYDPSKPTAFGLRMRW
jgi:hypothetical protein